MIWSGIVTSRVNAVLAAPRMVLSVRSRQSNGPHDRHGQQAGDQVVADERVGPRAGVNQRERGYQVRPLLGQ
jgi:hypothetical protein